MEVPRSGMRRAVRCTAAVLLGVAGVAMVCCAVALPRPAMVTELVETTRRQLRGAPAPKERRAGVVVLGMHRSGTSLFAGLMSRSGFWTADDDKDLLGFAGDHVDNKKGFYEREDLVYQNKLFLLHQEADWGQYVWRYDPSVTVEALKDPEAVFLDAKGRPHKLWHKGRGLVRTLQKSRDEPYVLKDPRLCLTAPVWFDLLDEEEMEPAVVFAKRSPLEVARSLEKRERWGVRRGLLLWMYYNWRAIDASRGRCVVMVDNRDVIENSVGELRRVLKGLQTCGVDIQPGKVSEELVRDWVDPELQHARSADPCKSLQRWNDARDTESDAEPEEAEDVYDAAMRMYCDMGTGNAFKADYDWSALRDYDWTKVLSKIVRTPKLS